MFLDMNFATCSLCKEQGHSTNKCPDLVDPLKPGFSGAGGGGGGHSHDDDDESYSIHPFISPVLSLRVAYKNCRLLEPIQKVSRPARLAQYT